MCHNLEMNETAEFRSMASDQLAGRCTYVKIKSLGGVIVWKLNKLWEALSRLYRSQILQQNMRWKALDGIYKIYMLLHRSDLNILTNFRRFFGVFNIRNPKNFDFSQVLS